MIDMFLKFANEKEADSVLFAQEAEGLTAKFPGSIDVIGTIYTGTGKMLMSIEGPYEETIPVSGWHVNIRHSEPIAELVKYEIFPNSPSRNWF